MSNIKKILGEAETDDLICVSADHKDVDEFVNDLIEALASIGVFAVRDPLSNGSDNFGVLLSKTPITSTRVKQYERDTQYELGA